MADEPTPLAGLPGYFILRTDPTAPQQLVEQQPPNSDPNDIFNILVDPIGAQQIVTDAQRGVPNSDGVVFFPHANMGFSRTSGASRMTSSQSINLVGANVLRTEDRGNGNGPLTLLEGERENEFDQRQPSLYSNQSVNITVNALGGTSLVDARAQDTCAWDGTANAQIFDVTGRNTIATNYTQSVWIQVLVGTNTQLLFLAQQTTQGGDLDMRLTSSPSIWVQLSVTGAYAAALAIGQLVRTEDLEIKTLIWDGSQLEKGTFPSSYVDIAGAPVSRDPDVLSVGAGGYPERLVHQDFNFGLAPYFASTDVRSAEVVVMSFGIANELRITPSNTFKLVVGGATIFESSPLTWSRHQFMVVSFNWLTPILKVSGATSGNFIAGWLSTAKWPLTGTGFRWGGRFGANGVECFANYGEPKIGVAA